MVPCPGCSAGIVALWYVRELARASAHSDQRDSDLEVQTQLKTKETKTMDRPRQKRTVTSLLTVKREVTPIAKVKLIQIKKQR